MWEGLGGVMREGRCGMGWGGGRGSAGSNVMPTSSLPRQIRIIIV